VPAAARLASCLRHRPGDAGWIQPALPAVPHRVGPGQAALRIRRLAWPAAGPARAHRVLRPARAGSGGPAGAGVQGRRAADGGLAPGQAALHRPADRPPPAGAGRDFLQFGHDQDPAPDLLPQRLHLRPACGVHRVHRERRAGGHAHLPGLLP
ncbi:MAG: Isocitrate dehydrogenase phosphatase/kinase, partial [uncultured Ramlibacter sp.]